MKLVAMYFARLPDPLRPGRIFRSRHRMTVDDIARAGGTPIEQDVEMREVATTEAEMRGRLNTKPGGYGPRR